MILPLIFLLAISLGACSRTPADDPAKNVAAYWQALIKQDAARLSSLSCAAYESTALTTMESFQSVEVVIHDLTCVTADASTDSATVNCTGSIVASYGAEDLTIDLSTRSYNVVKENGEWRMCGEK